MVQIYNTRSVFGFNNLHLHWCYKFDTSFTCNLSLLSAILIFRWEEEPKQDGVKWNFLEHQGPVFAPPYEPLPDNVVFYYDKEKMKLGENAEEVAGFYSKMLDHEYTTRAVFNTNFFKDWRKVGSIDVDLSERKVIKNELRIIDVGRSNVK